LGGDSKRHDHGATAHKENGTVRIPAAILNEVAAAAVEAMGIESRLRNAILDRVAPQDAYRRFGKF
jgi:regulator of RNase E activity RraA